jgi:hypothetical protein
MVKLELKKTFDFKTGKVVDKVPKYLSDFIGRFQNPTFRSPGVFTREIDRTVLGGPESRLEVYGDSGMSNPFIGYHTNIDTSRLQDQVTLMEDVAEVAETVSVDYSRDLEYLRSRLTTTLRVPRSFTI